MCIDIIEHVCDRRANLIIQKGKNGTRKYRNRENNGNWDKTVIGGVLFGV